jgi:aspartyl protease family protein
VSNFLKFAMVAIVAAASAAASAEAVVLFAPQAPELRAAKAEAPVGGRSATDEAAPGGAAIRKSSDGHYWAEGEVNGATVRFLVDTGATAVALTPDDAQRLGLKPDDLHYAYRVVTAGGQARAASVRLASVTVAGARLDDVDALVIEKGLDTSLLGMTYLGRLSRFEATRNALTLQP